MVIGHFLSQDILGQQSEILGQTYRSNWPDTFDFAVAKFPKTNQEECQSAQLCLESALLDQWRWKPWTLWGYNRASNHPHCLIVRKFPAVVLACDNCSFPVSIWARFRDSSRPGNRARAGNYGGWQIIGVGERGRVCCVNTHHDMPFGLRAREWAQSVWFNNVS